MRLFMLGATGRMGQLLVSSALAHSHEVTAFVRSPHKMAMRDSALTVLGGDPLAADQLAGVLPSHDVVISTFGPRGYGESTVCRQFGRALVHAMEGSDVQRLVITSTGLLFRGNVLARVLAATVFRHVVADLAGMERWVIDSALQWTIARPPRLTNRGAINQVRVANGTLPPRGLSATRADVARFLLAEAEHPAHVGKVVGVAN